MELTGTWRAALADEALRRAWQDDGFDASGWEAVEVPGHWRSTPAFADSDGPLLYRRSFEAAAAGFGRRSWLTLDGLFYQGDVWLDGAYLGDTEGYFVPHTFEVTDALRARAEHHLAVEVTCSPPGDLTAKRNLTGRVPALGLPRPGLEPRRHLAPRPRHGDRPRAHRRAAGALPRGRARAGRRGAAGHARQRGPPHGGAVHHASERSTTGSSSPWPTARTRSSGRSRSTTRCCGGRGPSASRRCRTSPSPSSSSRRTGRPRTSAACGPACARSGCAAGSPR